MLFFHSILQRWCHSKSPW